MSECLNQFLLNRNQYIESRDFVRTDYQLSSWSVPFVSDDILYGIPNFRGVYSKGFVGHTGGTVASGPIGPPPIPYRAFAEAIRNKDLNTVNAIGAQNPRLVDPYCLFDVEYEGLYRASFTIPIAPGPYSAQAQAEMLEVYSMALLRDYHLILLDPSDGRYGTLSTSEWNDAKNRMNTIITQLNAYNQPLGNPLQAPVNGSGFIQNNLLYRGRTTGDLKGPYISQLFYYSAFPGNMYINQNYLVADISFNSNDVSGTSFNNTPSTFANIWNGGTVGPTGDYALRYLSTIRDVAIYINKDEVWQPFFIAVSALLDRGIPTGFFTKSRKAGTSRFINLGPVDLWGLMVKAMKQAMNATWVWKWQQLRLRPEEMAYQINLSQNFGYTLDFSQNFLNNQILTNSTYGISGANSGQFILPLTYSNGSPCHPAYPAGHATIAGSLATVVKAYFNCDGLIEGYVPKVSTLPYNVFSGTQLELYRTGSTGGPTGFFRIDDEVDKMASNCSFSRAMGGVHYRSDCEAGLNIGENVAIAVLQQEVFKYDDEVNFRFRKRDGTIVNIYNGTGTPPAPTGPGVYYTTPKNIIPSTLPKLNRQFYVYPPGTVASPDYPDDTSRSFQNWGGGPGF